MAIGYIEVNVFTSRAEIPIKNAFVSVTSGRTDNINLLGFRTTNANGRTDILSIETPNIDLSLTPSNVKPFATCDIRVTHPSYYTRIIDNVQVFANTQTLQNVELIPLEENSEPETRVIETEVPAQNL